MSGFFQPRRLDWLYDNGAEFNLKTHAGLRGNGSADESPRIADFLDWLTGKSGGQTVRLFLPRGTYILATAQNGVNQVTPPSFTSWIGEGKAVSMFKLQNTNGGNMFNCELNDSNTAISDISFRHIGFDWDRDNNFTVSGGSCMRATSCTDLVIEDCAFLNPAGYGISLGGQLPMARVKILGNYIYNVGDDGLDVKNDSNANFDLLVAYNHVKSFSMFEEGFDCGIDMRGQGIIHSNTVEGDFASAIDSAEANWDTTDWSATNQMGPAKVGIRAREGTTLIANGDAGHKTLIFGNRVINTNASRKGIGIQAGATKVKVFGNYVEHLVRGVGVGATNSSTNFIASDCTIEGNTAYDCDKGYYVEYQSTSGKDNKRNLLTGNKAIDCAESFSIEADDTALIGNSSTGATTRTLHLRSSIAGFICQGLISRSDAAGVDNAPADLATHGTGPKVIETDLTALP